MDEPIVSQPAQQEESIKPETQENQTDQEEKQSRWDTRASTGDVPYYQSDPLYYKVADYFGLDSRETDLNRNKIIEIMNWGRNESATKDDGDVMTRIKDLEKKTGTLPGMVEKRHVILYRYILLSNQKTNIEKEMKMWGGGE